MAVPNAWTTISTKVVYQNQWIRVREDRFVRPDGGPGLYGVIEIRPSVGIVVIDAQDRVALIGQYRYTLGRVTWEIPRGGSAADETDMLAVAQRELREEAGVTALDWLPLGAVDVCDGVTDDVQHLFLAQDLREAAAEPDPEEDLTVRWVTFPDAVAMVMSGEVTEVCSVAAILKVEYLRRRRTE